VLFGLKEAEGKLLAGEERRTAEQRRRNADDMLNREEGKLMISEERRSAEQRKRKADDK
jgi:hypothetical protein